MNEWFKKQLEFLGRKVVEQSKSREGVIIDHDLIVIILLGRFY